MMKNVLYFLGILSLISIYACAGVPVSQKEKQISVSVAEDSVYKSDDFWPDKKLEKAFAEYWRLRIARNVEGSFQGEAPHFREMANSARYKAYVENYRNDVSEIRMKNREYESERLLNIVFSFVVPGHPDRIEVREKWLLLNGEWYHLVRDVLFFPELEEV